MRPKTTIAGVALVSYRASASDQTAGARRAIRSAGSARASGGRRGRGSDLRCPCRPVAASQAKCDPSALKGAAASRVQGGRLCADVQTSTSRLTNRQTPELQSKSARGERQRQLPKRVVSDAYLT